MQWLTLLILCHFVSFGFTNDDNNHAKQKTLLKLINYERERQALPILEENSGLAFVAKQHVKEMVKHNFLSHIGADGSLVGHRVARAGYAWQLVGEVMAHQPVPSDEHVLTPWLASNSHRQVLMAKHATDIGIAVQQGPDNHSFWDVIVALPDPKCGVSAVCLKRVENQVATSMRQARADSLGVTTTQLMPAYVAAHPPPVRKPMLIPVSQMGAKRIAIEAHHLPCDKDSLAYLAAATSSSSIERGDGGAEVKRAARRLLEVKPAGAARATVSKYFRTKSDVAFYPSEHTVAERCARFDYFHVVLSNKSGMQLFDVRVELHARANHMVRASVVAGNGVVSSSNSGVIQWRMPRVEEDGDVYLDVLVSHNTDLDKVDVLVVSIGKMCQGFNDCIAFQGSDVARQSPLGAHFKLNNEFAPPHLKYRDEL